jgi:hypothetical protein
MHATIVTPRSTTGACLYLVPTGTNVGTNVGNTTETNTTHKYVSYGHVSLALAGFDWHWLDLTGSDTFDDA